MRIEDGTPARLRIHALEDVLEEGVVGAALRWRTEEVPAPLIALPRFAVPLLDGVRRIGQDHVIARGLAVILGKSVLPVDIRIVKTVQHQVLHPSVYIQNSRPGAMA